MSAVAARALLFALALAGCSSRDEVAPARQTSATHPAAPDGRPLRPVMLPDVSTMTESVQKQIRDRHASLLTMSEGRQAPLVLADAYGGLGMLLMAASYPDAAEPCLLNAQTLAPDDGRWPYYLGHLYRNRGDLGSSVIAFEQVLRLRPDDVATLVWLGDLHLAEGRPDKASPRFSKALTLQPNSLSARFGLGRTALATQDYKGAVEY
ncbi:MAG: tetratricopeptide repeat protein, partial [Vicinamibacterales bacterium]